jgi:septal ring factor EnvC (AmiA/AmiB activator)
MKKFYLFLFCFFCTFSLFAQTTDPVSSELQEKAKKLETQVRSIQQCNATLNKDLSGVKIAVDSLGTTLVSEKDFAQYVQISNWQTESLVKFNSKIHKIVKYYKLMAVGTSGLFLLLLILLLMTRTALSKKLQESSQQVDAAKAQLAEQKESYDKKIAALAADLAKTNAEITKLSKPKKKEE